VDTVASVDDKSDPPWSPPENGWMTTDNARTRRKQTNAKRRKEEEEEKNGYPSDSISPRRIASSFMSPGYASFPSTSEDSRTVDSSVSTKSQVPSSLD
jgi:hypothetical protein